MPKIIQWCVCSALIWHVFAFRPVVSCLNFFKKQPHHCMVSVITLAMFMLIVKWLWYIDVLCCGACLCIMTCQDIHYLQISVFIFPFFYWHSMWFTVLNFYCAIWFLLKLCLKFFRQTIFINLNCFCDMIIEMWF